MVHLIWWKWLSMECHQGAGHKGRKASWKKAKLKQVSIDDNCVALSTASPSQATISQRIAKETRSQYVCTSSTNTVPQSSYPPPPADATFQPIGSLEIIVMFSNSLCTATTCFILLTSTWALTIICHLIQINCRISNRQFIQLISHRLCHIHHSLH